MKMKRTVRCMDYPENGVTVAMLGSGENSVWYDAMDIMERLLSENSKYLHLSHDEKRYEDLRIKHYYKGISKCNTFYDTYNKETCRAIAEEKCREKYETAVNKRLIKFLNDIYKLEAAVEQELIRRDAIDLCDICDGFDCDDCK